MSNKTLFYSLRYVESIFSNKYTQNFLLPNIEKLLFEFMIPLFFLEPEEFSEFENDYNEYLQKELD